MSEEFEQKRIDDFLNNNTELKDKLNGMDKDLKNLIVRGQLYDSMGHFKASMIYSTIALYIACGSGSKIKHDKMTLLENMATQARERFQTQIKNAAMGGEDSIKFKPIDEKTIIDKSTGLQLDYETLIGMNREKIEMNSKFILPQLNPELFFRSTNNALLFGPPGTGKTMLAKASVVEFNKKQKDKFRAIFFSETASSLKSKWEGGTEKQIQQLFEEADKQAKDKQKDILKDEQINVKVLSVIFLDEIEEITMSRSISDTSGSTVTTLLQQMGGLKTYDNVSVIAATNYPWNIDDAIMRRFPTKLFVDFADGYTRFHMLCVSILDKFISHEPERLCEFEFKDVDHNENEEFDQKYTEFKKLVEEKIDEKIDEKIKENIKNHLFPSDKVFDIDKSTDSKIKLKPEDRDANENRIKIFINKYINNNDYIEYIKKTNPDSIKDGIIKSGSIKEFITFYQKETLFEHLKKVLQNLDRKDKKKYKFLTYSHKYNKLKTSVHMYKFLEFMFFISLYIGPNNYSYRSGFVLNRFTYRYTHTKFGYSNSDIISLVAEFFTKMAESILSNKYTDFKKTDTCGKKKIYKKGSSKDEDYETVKDNFVSERATVNYKHMKDALKSFRPSSDTLNYCSHVCYDNKHSDPESCKDLCKQIREELNKKGN